MSGEEEEEGYQRSGPPGRGGRKSTYSSDIRGRGSQYRVGPDGRLRCREFMRLSWRRRDSRRRVGTRYKPLPLRDRTDVLDIFASS